MGDICNIRGGLITTPNNLSIVFPRSVNCVIGNYNKIGTGFSKFVVYLSIYGREHEYYTERSKLFVIPPPTFLLRTGITAFHIRDKSISIFVCEMYPKSNND